MSTDKLFQQSIADMMELEERVTAAWIIINDVAKRHQPHKRNCGMVSWSGNHCTCGLDALNKLIAAWLEDSQ